ncbi:MAG: hypothetical protein C0513_07805, partial [Isosphaera sp.]|nr:hypothetical protein [Isosphaera sp.]
MPGRPEVAPYLHGVADWEPPETHVAWRADIALLAAASREDDMGQAVPCSKDELEEVFEAFPLRSVEQLRDRSDRVQEELQKIAKRLKDNAQNRTASPPPDHAESEDPNDTSNEPEGEVRKGEGRPIESNPWVVLMHAGTMERARLDDIAPADKGNAKQVQRRPAFATVVLPVEVGGLKDGMLKGDEPPTKDARSLDVAEVARDGTPSRQRVVLKGDESGALLDGKIADGVTRASVILATTDEDAEPGRIEYRVAKGQDREPGRRGASHGHTRPLTRTDARRNRRNP